MTDLLKLSEPVIFQMLIPILAQTGILGGRPVASTILCRPLLSRGKRMR